MLFSTKILLEKHISACIVGQSDAVKKQHLEFASYQEVCAWIGQTQLSSKSYFSQHGGCTDKKGTQYIYKYCQLNHGRFSADFIPTVRKTDRKNKAGLVPDFSCPAKIAIHNRDGRFYVKYLFVHNHPCLEEYLKFQPFPVSVKEECITQMEMGISNPSILGGLRSSKFARANRGQDVNIDKADYVTSRYI